MFQWLQMRITEEQERRKKEAAVLARLPGALEELRRQLTECVEAFDAAFGPDQAGEVLCRAGKIKVTVRTRTNGQWQDNEKVEVTMLPALPGFQVERPGSEPMMIDVGMLPGDKLFYRTSDKFLTEEELTRRVLDHVLFPKLTE
jgi:hypothetical protein